MAHIRYAGPEAVLDGLVDRYPILARKRRTSARCTSSSGSRLPPAESCWCAATAAAPPTRCTSWAN